MRTYYAQITAYDSSAPADVIAINNPVEATNSVLIRCVANVHAESVTIANYRLSTFDTLVIGGTPLTLEPGDLSPRIARRDPRDAQPGFVALSGAFTPPSTPIYDETFTVQSRQGSQAACRELGDGPVILRPGSSAVLHLLGSDFPTASVAIDIVEQDLSPDIHIGDASFRRLLGERFAGSGSLNADNWTVATANGGSATLTGGALVLSTGASANGSVTVERTRFARFLTGAAHEFIATVRVPDAGTSGNTRSFGAFNANNGVGYRLTDTTFAVFARKDGVDAVVASGSWDELGFALDTLYRDFSILYDRNRFEFRIDGVLWHVLDPRTSAPRIGDHDLPIRFEAVNGGGLASTRTLEVIAAAIKRHGPSNGAPVYHHHPGTAGTVVLKAGSGTLSKALVTQAGSGGSLITLYDNTVGSGNVIARINADALQTLTFDVEFAIGLTLVATVNSGDVTVVYD